MNFRRRASVRLGKVYLTTPLQRYHEYWNGIFGRSHANFEKYDEEIENCATHIGQIAKQIIDMSERLNEAIEALKVARKSLSGVLTQHS